MIYILFILSSIGIARAMQTFNMPDIKPFNCQSCMSFWGCVALIGFYDWHMIPLAFISYLLSDLILVWEQK